MGKKEVSKMRNIWSVFLSLSGVISNEIIEEHGNYDIKFLSFTLSLSLFLSLSPNPSGTLSLESFFLSL